MYSLMQLTLLNEKRNLSKSFILLLSDTIAKFLQECCNTRGIYIYENQISSNNDSYSSYSNRFHKIFSTPIIIFVIFNIFFIHDIQNDIKLNVKSECHH